MAVAFHESHVFISAAIAAGKSVLVHCVEGKSRSVRIILTPCPYDPIKSRSVRIFCPL